MNNDRQIKSWLLHDNRLLIFWSPQMCSNPRDSPSTVPNFVPTPRLAALLRLTNFPLLALCNTL